LRVIRVFSQSESTPLANAYVGFELLEGERDLPFGRTNADGYFPHPIPPPSEEILIFLDAPDHQTLVLPHTRSRYSIILPRVAASKEGLGWWHRRCGVSKFAHLNGETIKIGMVDSGCVPTPCLNRDRFHDLGTISMAGHDPADVGKDEDWHGTSVGALITGKPSAADFTGFAPNAELYSVRISFEPNPEESNQSLIADALELLVEQKVHLINCSFGFDKEHVDVERWLNGAWEAGILVICATGNHRPTVCFPARWPKAVSVGAFGDRGHFDARSDSARTAPAGEFTHLWDPPLFIPNFVPRQGRIDCIAPGVGIVVTEPPRGEIPCCNKQKSGTSFSCPIVTGLLATVLSGDKAYKKLTASAPRAEYARAVLDRMCRPLGFAERQGKGLPTLRGS
jgi:subtilisin family serine protease